MSEALDRLAQLARLNEDALRDAAAQASAEGADALIDRASERASQVEQLRALDRPHGITAAALPPSPHAPGTVNETERALAHACREALDGNGLSQDAQTLVARIAATCR